MKLFSQLKFFMHYLKISKSGSTFDNSQLLMKLHKHPENVDQIDTIQTRKITK